MKDCKHPDFEINNHVVCIADEEGEIKEFMLHTTVKCAGCGLPFEFMALPRGASLMQPMVSTDATEVRMPICPSTDAAELLKSMQ
jgi:hypothetical protein